MLDLYKVLVKWVFIYKSLDANVHKNDINQTIKDYSIDSSDNSFNKDQMILPWRLFLGPNGWGPHPLAIFFNNASFYMVDPNVGGVFI